jgi:hypothetical protein
MNVRDLRPFRTPWLPLVAVLGIIFNAYMMNKLGIAADHHI